MNGIYGKTADSRASFEEELRGRLDGKSGPLRFIYHDTVGSTNTEAKLLKKDGIPTLLVADGQTGGRGRMGKTFTCPKGMGIYMSLLLYPEMRAEDSPILTAGAAVAVSRAIERTTGVKTQIKWVNDLYVGGRKLAGILTEGSASPETGMLEYSIIGIGINVFDSDLGIISDIATSLEKEGAKSLDRAELIAGIVEEILSRINNQKRKTIIDEYKSLSMLKSLPVRVTRGGISKRATALSVNDDLSLSVRYEDGKEEALLSADVSVHPEIYDN